MPYEKPIYFFANVQPSQFCLQPWKRPLSLRLSTHWLAIESYAVWKVCSLQHYERLTLERPLRTAESERVEEFGLPIHDHLVAYVHQEQMWAVLTALFTCIFLRVFGWYHVWHTVDTALMCIPNCLSSHLVPPRDVLAIYPMLLWACPSSLLSMPHIAHQYLFSSHCTRASFGIYFTC